jgi:hypothetical protein
MTDPEVHDGADPIVIRWDNLPLSVEASPLAPGLTITPGERNTAVIGSLEEKNPGGVHVLINYTHHGTESFSLGASVALTPDENNTQATIDLTDRSFESLPYILENPHSIVAHPNKTSILVLDVDANMHFSINLVADKEDRLRLISFDAVDPDTEASPEDTDPLLPYEGRSVDETALSLAKIVAYVCNSLRVHTGNMREGVIKLGLVDSQIESARESNLPASGGNLSKGLPEHKEFPTFQDFGGLQQQIQQIRDHVDVFLAATELLQKYGAEAKPNVIMQGPGGTGKTSLVRATAREYGFRLIEVRVSDVQGVYAGETSQKLRRLYEEATSTEVPTILFFDEADGLFSNGAGGNTGVARSLVAELKATLARQAEHPNVMTWIATNTLDGFDPALLRAGRFDTVVKCFAPDESGRSEIWRRQVMSRTALFQVLSDESVTGNAPIPDDPVEFGPLGRASEDMTGADIASVIKSMLYAMMLAEIRTGEQPVPYSQTDIIIAIERYRRNRPSDI